MLMCIFYVYIKFNYKKKIFFLFKIKFNLFYLLIINHFFFNLFIYLYYVDLIKILTILEIINLNLISVLNIKLENGYEKYVGYKKKIIYLFIFSKYQPLIYILMY